MNKYWVITPFLFALAGCPKPTPGPGDPPPSPAPISCGGQALETCASSALPGVLACLDGTEDATSCLLGLVRPVGCAAYEVIACLVRGEGSRAEHLAQAEKDHPPIVGIMGPTGPDNWRRAARAKEFLSRTGARFDDGEPQRW